MIKVLLVEDDKNLCFILRSSLEQMIGGYQVTVATNGRQGLEALEREAFDVVVSDVEMPVMDGKEMTHAIRERHPNLAIILITGLTTARDVINGYQSGADFYIKKPFLPEELDAHIQAILRMKRENRPAPIAEKETNVTYTIGQYRFVPSGNQLLFGDERQGIEKSAFVGIYLFQPYAFVYLYFFCFVIVCLLFVNFDAHVALAFAYDDGVSPGFYGGLSGRVFFLLGLQACCGQ